MNIPTPVPIISPKLQIPPSRLQLVPRERLLERLNAGIHRKLSLISAPAGYGKTTLLSEWAARCEWRLSWITLAEGDNDPERFLAYLVSAVQTADARLANLDGILGPRFSLQPMSLEAMLAVLVNELSSVGERLVIVLDDFHVIENEEIHGFLNALLDNLPSNIQLVIASRVDRGAAQILCCVRTGQYADARHGPPPSGASIIRENIARRFRALRPARLPAGALRW